MNKNGSSYSLSSRTVVKGVEQGLYLCRSGPFTINAPFTIYGSVLCTIYCGSVLCAYNATPRPLPKMKTCRRYRQVCSMPTFKVQHNDDGCCHLLVMCLLCFNISSTVTFKIRPNIFAIHSILLEHCSKDSVRKQQYNSIIAKHKGWD